jgi:hypothetical protein
MSAKKKKLTVLPKPKLSRTDILIAQAREENPNLIKFCDLDDAIIGHGRQHGSDELLIYSARKLIETIGRVYKMDHDAAIEWFGNNVACLYAGPGTPIIMNDLDLEEA